MFYFVGFLFYKLHEFVHNNILFFPIICFIYFVGNRWHFNIGS